MKNKKLLWILAPAVIVIWGIIIYQVMAALKGNEEVHFVEPKKLSIASATLDTVSYTLVLNYQDPFLKNNKRPVTTSPVKEKVLARKQPPRKQPVVQKVIKEVPVRWPSVLYMGVVAGRQKSLCLVQVDGVSLFFAQGQTHGQLKLLKVYEDSVRIGYQGKEEKTFLKK